VRIGHGIGAISFVVGLGIAGVGVFLLLESTSEPTVPFSLICFGLLYAASGYYTQSILVAAGAHFAVIGAQTEVLSVLLKHSVARNQEEQERLSQTEGAPPDSPE
jgi:hypothetical membrane protein